MIIRHLFFLWIAFLCPLLTLLFSNTFKSINLLKTHFYRQKIIIWSSHPATESFQFRPCLISVLDAQTLTIPNQEDISALGMSFFPEEMKHKTKGFSMVT